MLIYYIRILSKVYATLWRKERAICPCSVGLVWVYDTLIYALLNLNLFCHQTCHRRHHHRLKMSSISDRLHSMVHHSSLIISNRNMSSLPNAVHRLLPPWGTSSTVGDRTRKKILLWTSMTYLPTHPLLSLLYLQRCTMNFLLASWRH